MTTTPSPSDSVGIRSGRYVDIPSKRIPALTEPTRDPLPRASRRKS